MEIRIGKCARDCRACDRAFVHEEVFRSLVCLENQALVREDYCGDCWSPDRATGAFSVWSARFYDPKVAEQQPPEVFSPLRQAFYESAEAEDQTEVAKAYLAAQMLRRQKVFRFIKESQDPDTEERIALFSDRIGNSLVEVRDPNLSYEELENGRRALLERLQELEEPVDEEEQAEEDSDVTEQQSIESPPASQEDADVA